MGGRQVPSGGQVIGRSAELYSNGPPESQSVTGRGHWQLYNCIVWGEEEDGTHAGQIVHSASRRGFPGPGRPLYTTLQMWTYNLPTNSTLLFVRQTTNSTLLLLGFCIIAIQYQSGTTPDGGVQYHTSLVRQQFTGVRWGCALAVPQQFTRVGWGCERKQEREQQAARSNCQLEINARETNNLQVERNKQA